MSAQPPRDWAAAKELGDVVLVDILEGMPQGKALDLMQARPIYGFNVNVVGTNGYDETAGSDVVIITSGLARKPGMSREDLLNKNTEIVAGVTKAVVAKSPNAILINVANPLDAMRQCGDEKVSGLPRERVMGMAGILDTARFRCFLAMESSRWRWKSIQSMVLGGHGDDMVPILSATTVSGMPITQFVKDKARLDAMVDRDPQGRRRDRLPAQDRLSFRRPLRRGRADGRSHP